MVWMQGRLGRARLKPQYFQILIAVCLKAYPDTKREAVCLKAYPDYGARIFELVIAV
jgi:hypothetical protein